jgi:DNA adenine methylase
MSIQKPFLKWVGGKTQIMDKIINRIPKNMENYFEIFLGGGSVLLAVLSKKNEILIKEKVYAYDKNEGLIYVYKNIQTNSEELKKEITKYKNIYDDIGELNGNKKPQNLEEAKQSKESYYYWIRKKFNSIDKKSVEASALFIILNKTGFRGMYREGPNGFNIPFGNYKKTPTFINGIEMDKVKELIKDVIFEVKDFSDSIKNLNENDFVYLDPPYAPKNDDSFVGYVKEGFGLENHKKLFKIVKSLKCKFLFHNAKVELIEKEFSDYNIEEQLCRRAINSKNPGSKAMEVIIQNY